MISVCRGGVPSLHRIPGCIACTLASGAVLARLSVVRIYLSGCAQGASLTRVRVLAAAATCADRAAEFFARGAARTVALIVVGVC